MQFQTRPESWRWTVEIDVPAQFRETRTLHDRWRRLRGRSSRRGLAGLPARGDFAGRALAPYVKHLFTVAPVPVTEDGEDFAFATIGSAVRSAFGLDTGLGASGLSASGPAAVGAQARPARVISPVTAGIPVDRLFAAQEEAAQARRLYRLVLRRGRPVVAAGHVQAGGGAWATFEAVHLPVADAENGQIILGGLFLVDAVDDGQ